MTTHSESAQTWEDAIADAFAGVDRAYAHRRAVCRAANEAGLSMRNIGAVVGKSSATVHKIIGGARKPRDVDALLNAPAVIPEQEQTP